MIYRLAAAAALLLVLVVLVSAGVAGAASLHQVRAQSQVRRLQLHRDRGTVRFMLRHRWSRAHRGFMRAEKQAERRIPVELASLARMRRLAVQLSRPTSHADVAAWLPTVACENGGRWADSPGPFYLGLQFDPATWASASRATGVYGTSPAAQVVNATWTALEARREGMPDPWPNCPDPYYG